jgi:putative toxin-antitoxin system antitoxin component (TIGR02293 family)
MARDSGIANEEAVFKATAALLGGTKMLGGPAPKTRLQVHEKLAQGIPSAAAAHLVSALFLLDEKTVVVAGIGMSARTYLRQKSKKARLDVEHSGRAWKFAEVLTKASSVLGSQQAAERWLKEPAMGLDRQRPIDLLKTQAGTQLVEEFLERIDLGAYS